MVPRLPMGQPHSLCDGPLYHRWKHPSRLGNSSQLLVPQNFCWGLHIPERTLIALARTLARISCGGSNGACWGRHGLFHKVARGVCKNISISSFKIQRKHIYIYTYIYSTFTPRVKPGPLSIYRADVI